MSYIITSDDRNGTATIRAQGAQNALTIAQGWADIGRIHIAIESPDGEVYRLRQFRTLLKA